MRMSASSSSIDPFESESTVSAIGDFGSERSRRTKLFWSDCPEPRGAVVSAYQLLEQSDWSGHSSQVGERLSQPPHHVWPLCFSRVS